MASSKIDYYSTMAEETAARLPREWPSFLDTAARMYKYPFQDQLLIYAQKRKATACASFELWNKAFNRHPKRGSNGIALIDDSGDEPRLHYVFDVSDTEPYSGTGRNVDLWDLKQYHDEPVIQSLISSYGQMNGELSDVIYNVSRNLANEYIDSNNNDIVQVIPYCTEWDFRETLTDSVNYTILSRCMLLTDSHIDNLPRLSDFTPVSVKALGKAVSVISEQVLRGIETAVKQYDFEREKQYERRPERQPGQSQIQTIDRRGISSEIGRTRQTTVDSGRNRHNLPTSGRRGLFDSQYISTGNETAEHIRPVAQRLPETTPTDYLQRAITFGEIVGSPLGNRPDGGGTDGAADGRTDKEISTARQGNATNGVGRTHEQPARTGSGNRFHRANLQLTLFDAEPVEAVIQQQNIEPHIPEIGDRYRIQGRTFEVDDISASNVTLRDITFQQNTGFPIFRSENIDFIKMYSPIFQANSSVSARTPQEEVEKTESPMDIPSTEEKFFDKQYSLEYRYSDDGITVLNRLAETSSENGAIAQINSRREVTFYESLPEDETAEILQQARGSELLVSSMATDTHVFTTPAARDIYIPDTGDRYRINERVYKVGIVSDTEIILQDAATEETTSVSPAFLHDYSPLHIPNIRDLYHIEGKTYSVVGVSAKHVIFEDIDNPARERLTLPLRYLKNNGYEAIWDLPSSIDESFASDASEFLTPPEAIPEKEAVSIRIRTSEYVNAIFLHDDNDPSTMYASVDADRTIVYKSADVLSNLSPATIAAIEEIARTYDFSSNINAPEAQEAETTPEPEQPQAENFRITDMNLGNGGAKTKYIFNTDAIRTLKLIETENRPATPEEKTILSRYVGFGGIPQAFDDENEQWAREYAELKELLSAEEYESARRSTLNAHYTSPIVIQAMYETIERLGFKRGDILEPSCGVGNFLGMLPDSFKDSKLYGVELDGLTGRIAQKLYPNADIQIKGFEKLDTPDDKYDLAIGNVPFGDFGVVDKRYDSHNFYIHDYFFAKTIDKVRPGGIVAFITSQGTMDKKSPEVRRYIAQRAELLGAVRLPNNAFLKNAGTEVTADIVFLQKRERQIEVNDDWIHRGVLENGIPLNNYFAEHPEMILGRMIVGKNLYGRDGTYCVPIEGADLSEQLRQAMSYIKGSITEPIFEAVPESTDNSIVADPNVRNFSFAVLNGIVYYRENSRMTLEVAPAGNLERIKGMIGLRDCARELINYQLDGRSIDDINDKQQELNKLYDSFSEKYGLINSAANKRAFSKDSAYYLLSSLEVLDQNGNLERKADMFTKRTISARSVVTSVDTSSEALAVSIAEQASVDLPYMSDLTGFSKEKIIDDLKGVIFRDLNIRYTGKHILFDEIPFVTAEEYLSGNVREKLQVAINYLDSLPPEQAAAIAPNIEALREAQPKDLDASEISVGLGSTWIDTKYVNQFVNELLEVPSYSGKCVDYSEHAGEWNVGTAYGANNVLYNVTYGTKRMNAFRIIKDTLNLRDVRVYDTIEEHGKKKTVLNKSETTKAQQKQEAIKQAFKDWVFNEPERRRDIVKTYNEKFNSTRPREYDGSHLHFVGINPEITLRTHQLNAIAHILHGGNTLLAHEVGAGKTWEMVAAAMEAKRLGLCNKSLFAVPNHITEQIGSDFLRLYPAANILVATEKDFETANRKKFCARIATGDYDAVIIGHSQLEKIPISKERQERTLRDQINDIIDGIEEMKSDNAPRYSIKQLEKTKIKLEARLEKILNEDRKDDVVTFEQLGCDKLFVDEAHSFKNLFLYTKMRNVAGIPQIETQKSSDLFMKCRYLDEITGGKGVVFATGTPVSNSMTEMYTMQRYLQYDALQQQGLAHFDSWASTFGDTVTAIELAPEGTGYRARTRFARFHNLPELMNMFKEAADIKTADMIDLPRPNAHYHTVVVSPSEIQKEMVEELSIRAAEVHSKLIEPEKDNMLKITSDGRKIGLDQRLINSLLPDFPGSKVNACTENVFNIWKETATERLTQLVFCDFSTPNSDGRFNVYDDIKSKLIEKGVPEKEIAFIHDAKTEAKKKELFEKVRRGDVRVLFGSTFKMGSGTNVQDRLIHLHDLDCPWRPADLEQRAGRIVRQGNMNPDVNITRYVTEGTFDAYLYQTIENKQKFISQIMTSKSPVRSCEDVDETALSYAEIKALCAGNPLIMEKMNLDIEVARLRFLKAEHQSQRYELEDKILQHYPMAIESVKECIAGYTEDQERLKTWTIPNKDGFSPMVIGGMTHTEKAEAGKMLIDMCKSAFVSKDLVKIGTYRGFDLYLSYAFGKNSFIATFKGAMHYSTPLGGDVHGNIKRLDNALSDIPDLLSAAKQQLEKENLNLETAKIEVKKPFPLEAELTAKAARLAELDSQLNMDNKTPQEPEIEQEAEPEVEKWIPLITSDDIPLDVPPHLTDTVTEMGCQWDMERNVWIHADPEKAQEVIRLVEEQSMQVKPELENVNEINSPTRGRDFSLDDTRGMMFFLSSSDGAGLLNVPTNMITVIRDMGCQWDDLVKGWYHADSKIAQEAEKLVAQDQHPSDWESEINALTRLKNEITDRSGIDPGRIIVGSIPHPKRTGVEI